MEQPLTLAAYFSGWAGSRPARLAIAATMEALASAAAELSDLLALGALAGPMGRLTGRKGDVDEQKEIDLVANNLLIDVLRKAPVAALASEEMEAPLLLDAKAPLLVAVDPLDGSSNIDANASIGTIFTVLPALEHNEEPSAFLQRGVNQLAGGFFLYGPQTVLVSTVGAGTQIFTLDRRSGTFLLTHPKVELPLRTSEYAVNDSNTRHWDDPVRTYIDDCRRGKEGPRGRDFNMRWTGSPVADFYRILSRGGIYLYPGDKRREFRNGRLRLIYEASPLAWVVEQAGGAASTGRERLLEVSPKSLHQRIPLIAGSRKEVEHAARLHDGLQIRGERSPLFSRRGLLRF
ncbi:class 1 fructose-bisphosphatase [Hyphomicrobium sulfonivorans]|uniref:class 1 fructose-bisphosphatase n=1 Tax=Hyphomicrobium sulfonivorans TaxID=121290 RepID=UPI00156E009A|nr:class 1 fructose-bisphosphatase [Hyphomicrobium sulfonivorans]MBI1648311.1 class 1 fructose-bisphosphatase [Hyphomicrobium sulfonivorans]NSL71154.1 class 1 fructose-bisphosphatase [Hyphomicrobium sulfonivorans]